MPRRCSGSPTSCSSATSLPSGELRTSEGVRIDLRNIKSPIIVFCSWGDDITPPQQALDWITDLYDHEDEIVANGQTIVYTLHQSIGHLGIFVSGKVATKEHEEFAQCDGHDRLDAARPLRGGDHRRRTSTVENPELVQGQYLFRLETRTLDDIRALGQQRAPRTNFVSPPPRACRRSTRRSTARSCAPVVRAAVTEQTGRDRCAQLHPTRLRFSLFSDENPLMQPVAAGRDGPRRTASP